MELKFIWVKEYGLLKEIGFNFNHGSNTCFEYDGSKLILKVRKGNVLRFGEKISGVTAIAGQNGSGKSSLCQIVLFSTATYTEGSFGYDYEFDGLICYDNHIFYHKDLVLNNREELRKKGFILSEYEHSPLEKIMFDENPPFAKDAFIYYSNMFDTTSAFSGLNLLNLSSTHHLYHGYKQSPAYSFKSFFSDISFNGRKIKDTKSDIDIFNLEQNYHNVKYYLEEHNSIPFSGPEMIILKSAYSCNNRWLRMKGEFEGEENIYIYDKAEREIFQEVYQWSHLAPKDYELQASLTSQQIKQNIKKLYRLNLLRAIAVETDVVLPETEVYEFVEKMVPPSYGVKKIERLMDLANLHTDILNISTVYKDFTFEPYIIQSHYEDIMEDWRFVYLENAFVPNDDTGRPMLAKLIKLEEEFMGDIRRISSYKFPNYFSSGELGYLTLFSRLRSALHRYETWNYGKENVIIFIDEGDVGFHPTWSKKLLKWILDFLNNRPEKIKFQLIFSTHSPYLLSDLTSQNILLLKRSADDRTEILSSEEFETFGANIYDLLANSFFLHDGTIGDFAKQEINKVIERLWEWKDAKDKGLARFSEIDEKEKSYVIGIITSISDQIVRAKLFEMFDEVFENEQIKQQEINYLENRINKLKGNDRN